MDCVVHLSSASYERLLALCILSESKYPQWLPVVNSFSYWGRERVYEEHRFVRLFSLQALWLLSGKREVGPRKRKKGNLKQLSPLLMPHAQSFWVRPGISEAQWGFTVTHNKALFAPSFYLTSPRSRLLITKVSLEPKSLHFLATLTAQLPIVIGFSINLHKTAQGKILV